VKRAFSIGGLVKCNYLHHMAGDRRNFDPPLNSSGEPELSGKVHNIALPTRARDAHPWVSRRPSISNQSYASQQTTLPVSMHYTVELTFSGALFFSANQLFTLDSRSALSSRGVDPTPQSSPLFTFCGGRSERVAMNPSQGYFFKTMLHLIYS
jgi:hypothetical protein